MFLVKESALSLKQKTTQHWFSYCKYLKSFKTDMLNISF